MPASKRLLQDLKNLSSIGPKSKPFAISTKAPKPAGVPSWLTASYITKTTPKRTLMPSLQSIFGPYEKGQKQAQKKFPGYSAVKESLGELGVGLKETYKIAKGRAVTPWNIAKTFAGGALNIAAAPFRVAEREATYMAEKTPLSLIKTETPLGTLTAPAAIGLAASLAMPVGGAAKANKIAKLKSTPRILKELFKIKSLKSKTPEELTILANRLAKINKPSEVTKVITEAAEKTVVKKLPPIGMKERGFITQVKKAKTTAPQVAKKVEGFYPPQANVETINKAEDLIKTQGMDEIRRLISTGEYSVRDAPEVTVAGELVSQRLQSMGMWDDATKVIDDLAVNLTRGGQTVQAAAIWSRLTPEGMLRYAVKTVNEGNKKMSIVSKMFRKTFNIPESKITATDSKVITAFMKKAQRATTEEEKAKWTLKAWEVIGKKLPWGVSDVLDEYRYANMLSNPLTHLRNAWSNLIQTFISRPATIAAEGRPLQALRYEVAAWKALPEAVSAFTKAVRKGETFKKLDIAKLGKQGPVKPRKLGRYNLPTTLMEAGDRFFSTMIKAGEIARGTPADEAARLAEYSLFRADLNPAGQGAFLNALDKFTKWGYGGRNVGLGWFIPFIRTPMNIAKQWVEFSPAGLATIPGAANKRTQLAKSIVGSMATLVGAKMAMEGRTTWDIPSDPIAKRLFYDAGKKPFSVKVGNRWVPLQTFGIFAWALGLPASIKYYTEEVPQAISDSDLDKLSKIVLSPIHFWSQQTFVSGLGAFVSLAQGKADWSIPKNIAFTASQMKPMNGLMRYVANVIDPVFRKAGTLEEQLKSDIPFLTKGLPAHETTEGEPAKRDPASFFLPYAQGVADSKYQRLYEQRMDKLRNNARTKVIKSIYEAIRDGSLSEEEGTQKILKLKEVMDTQRHQQTPSGAPAIFP